MTLDAVEARHRLLDVAEQNVPQARILWPIHNMGWITSHSVFYEDGSQTSNRKVPVVLGGRHSSGSASFMRPLLAPVS